MKWLFWWLIGSFEFLLGYLLGALLARSGIEGFAPGAVRQRFGRRRRGESNAAARTPVLP